MGNDNPWEISTANNTNWLIQVWDFIVNAGIPNNLNKILERPLPWMSPIFIDPPHSNSMPSYDKESYEQIIQEEMGNGVHR